jgi:hypothetical protein
MFGQMVQNNPSIHPTKAFTDVVLLIIWRSSVRIMWHCRLQSEYLPASDRVFASLESAAMTGNSAVTIQ